MQKDRILAIEDDEGVCRLLRHSLAREDYQVQVVHSGEEGLAAAIEDPPDLFLLDLELPGMDGLAVCRQLKSNPVTRGLPVIILTGKGEEADVVEGLEVGADDYIVKPFSPKILNARVQAVLRRRLEPQSSPAKEEILRLGNLTIDTGRNSVRIAQREIDLSPPEYHFILLLACYLSGEKLKSSIPEILDDEEPVRAIGREGMALFSENRLVRLLPVLAELAVAGYDDSATLCKFYGLALFETDSEMARHYLVEAEKKFQLENDPLGELMALSHLVFFHIIFDGDVKRALRYLERAEALSRVFFDRLSVFARISVAQNLAIGRSFLLSDFAGANEYLAIAEALAEDRGLVNQVVLNRLAGIHGTYVTGDREAMGEAIEASLRFVTHPQVSRLHKGLLRILQFKYLALCGNFSYQQLQEKWLKEEFSQQLFSDNLPSGLLILGQLESLLFQRRCDEALTLSSETLLRPAVLANDLIRPLLNGFKALSAALCHDSVSTQEALAACRAESAAATFRQASAELLCARAVALAGQKEEALTILFRVLPLAREQNWQNLVFQARAQLLLLGDPAQPDAQDSLGSLLTELKEQGVWYLPSLTAEDYHRLFRMAVCLEAGEAQARSMVRKRLMIEFGEDGNPFPLMQLETLGGLRVALGENLVARTDKFSRTQRECIALLASTPDHRITQEEVQLTFWPDKSPEKARSTLDTMISRLRRTLQELLAPFPVKIYLKLQKGVLSMENIVVDAVEVVRGINKARDLVRRRELWHADVAYSIALDRWKGFFMPGSCSADQSATYAQQVHQLCLDASLEWNELLTESGQTSRSIATLAHALSMDRCNEALMKALYRGHMRDGNIARAHQLLKQFEDVFRAEGYTPSEAARVLATFQSA